MKHLENSGIGVAIHYPCPLPFLDCYKERAYTSEDFPMAYHLSKTILSIPMYPELSKAQMDAVADAIHGYFQK
jgi:dTDP-4-amino-4,6-dideoxygalactose transaminase